MQVDLESMDVLSQGTDCIMHPNFIFLMLHLLSSPENLLTECHVLSLCWTLGQNDRLF